MSMRKIAVWVLLICVLLTWTGAFAEGSAWICPNDGTENTGNFCAECGSPRPAQAGSAKCEGEGYDTPEEAVAAYVSALNAGDVSGMLATFAVETYVDHMDPEAALAGSRTFTSSLYAAVPVTTPLSRALLVERRRNEITQRIYAAWLITILSRTDYSSAAYGSPVTLEDETAVSAFLEDVRAQTGNEWAGHLTLMEVVTPGDERLAAYLPNMQALTGEAAMTALDRILRSAGGDGLAERAAVMDWDGYLSLQFMQCIRYGDKWYNNTTQSYAAILTGANADMNGLGILRKPEE